MAASGSSNFTIRLALIVIAVIVLVILITQYNRKKTSVVVEETPRKALTHENFEMSAPSSMKFNNSPVVEPPKPVNISSPEVVGPKPIENADNEDYKAVDFSVESKIPTDCFPRDKLTVEDLLPKDAANSTWAQVNPAGQGDVKDQNFLSAGYHMGVNTVGQSLRNPNLQLRSDPPNPKLKVSPWNQSTIEYDVSRRYFEVGEC